MRANKSSIRLKHIALSTLLCVVTGPAVSAQTLDGTTSDLETVLTPGMTVWITDSTGEERKTRVVDVSDEFVTTSTAAGNIRRLRTADIERVKVRQSDSVLDGALIGAGVAVASGLFLCTRTEPWENCRDDVGPMVRIGAIGAGIGIAIDALIRGRRTIYEAEPGSTRLYAAPIISRDAHGLRVSLSF